DLEPLPRINLETCVEATATEDLGVCATKIEITFDRPGSLGIEFCELKSPFLVQEVHSHGLAYGQDLQKGDLLLTAGGQAVDGLPWDTLVGILTQRPVSVTFKREPARGTTDHAGSAAALLTGFTSNLWQLGGTVAQQGLDIGSKVSSVGLDLGVKGLDFGNVGFDLGGKVTSSFVGGLVGSVQDTSGGEASPDTSTLALDVASPSTDDDTVMVEAASASVISLGEESPVGGGMVANGHGSSNGHGQAEAEGPSHREVAAEARAKASEDRAREAESRVAAIEERLRTAEAAAAQAGPKEEQAAQAEQAAREAQAARDVSDAQAKACEDRAREAESRVAAIEERLRTAEAAAAQAGPKEEQATQVEQAARE
ncbi:unnamed protein product, partial [Polarella glacialis]